MSLLTRERYYNNNNSEFIDRFQRPRKACSAQIPTYKSTVCKHTQVRTHIHTHTHMRTRRHTHTHTHAHTRTHARAHTPHNTHTRTHARARARAHTHTHTHTKRAKILISSLSSSYVRHVVSQIDVCDVISLCTTRAVLISIFACCTAQLLCC